MPLGLIKSQQDILLSSEFHAEIAKKMDEVIAKILNEEPTEKQVAEIAKLQKEVRHRLQIRL